MHAEGSRLLGKVCILASAVHRGRNKEGSVRGVAHLRDTYHRCHGSVKQSGVEGFLSHMNYPHGGGPGRMVLG